MKTSLILAVSVTACVASLLALSGRDVLAQQPPRQPVVGNGAPPVVAVIDFEKLLQEYVRSKYIREQIKKDKENAEKAIRSETAEIEKEKEKLKELKPGSRDFKELEERLAQKVSEINVRFKIQQRDFQEREQKAFFVLYLEISEEVKHFADAKGISLVLPYSSEPGDPNSPESMQKVLSKTFVYQNGPDITAPVLSELNRRAMHSATRPQGGGGPAGGPNGGSQAPPTRTR